MDDVIEYISTEIGPEKSPLLSRLGMDQNSDETPLSEILKDIPWRKISFHLERLGRTDIVEHITKNTLVTEGKIIVLVFLFNIERFCIEIPSVT